MKLIKHKGFTKLGRMNAEMIEYASDSFAFPTITKADLENAIEDDTSKTVYFDGACLPDDIKAMLNREALAELEKITLETVQAPEYQYHMDMLINKSGAVTDLYIGCDVCKDGENLSVNNGCDGSFRAVCWTAEEHNKMMLIKAA